MSDPLLFEDSFTITSVLSGKYERVSRISAHTTSASAPATTTTQSQSQNPTNSQNPTDAASSQEAPPAIVTTDPSQIALTLDINCELYPLKEGDRITVAVAMTLNLDGRIEEGRKGWRRVAEGSGGGMGEATLADEYDYVLHGKVYRFEEGEGNDIRVFVSFGGLLMYLEGPYNKLNSLRLDYVYLLIKK